MINFIDGRIDLGSRTISVASSYQDLNDLAVDGLIEKRKDPSASGDYFFIDTLAEDIRFSVVISLQQTKVDYILLRWRDSPMKGWDDVSEKALKQEYRLLLNFVENNVGGPPDKIREMQRTWHCQWGQVDVSYEPRSFNVAIFMLPR